MFCVLRRECLYCWHMYISGLQFLLCEPVCKYSMKLHALTVYKPLLLTTDRTTFKKHPYFSHHTGYLDSILCELLKLKLH